MTSTSAATPAPGAARPRRTRRRWGRVRRAPRRSSLAGPGTVVALSVDGTLVIRSSSSRRSRAPRRSRQEPPRRPRLLPRARGHDARGRRRGCHLARRRARGGRRQRAVGGGARSFLREPTSPLNRRRRARSSASRSPSSASSRPGTRACTPRGAAGARNSRFFANDAVGAPGTFWIADEPGYSSSPSAAAPSWRQGSSAHPRVTSSTVNTHRQCAPPGRDGDGDGEAAGTAGDGDNGDDAVGVWGGDGEA